MGEKQFQRKITFEIFDFIKSRSLEGLDIVENDFKFGTGMSFPDFTLDYNGRPVIAVELKCFAREPDSIAINTILDRIFHYLKDIDTCNIAYLLTTEKAYRKVKGQDSIAETSFEGFLQDIQLTWSNLRAKNPMGSRIIAAKENAEKKKLLLGQRTQAQKEILQELQKEDDRRDKDKIKELESRVNLLNAQIDSLSENDDKLKQDKEVESEWGKRIETAFKGLRQMTDELDKERTHATVEWWIWIGLILLLTVALYFWYKWLIAQVGGKELSYLSLLPYMLPLPVYIAILWIGIIQKSKARKVHLAITNQLFNVRYLESLLMMINTLSITSQVAVENINSLLKEVIEHYIEQIGKKDIDIHEINGIENDENKANPLISKLIGIIKNLTSHD